MKIRLLMIFGQEKALFQPLLLCFRVSAGLQSSACTHQGSAWWTLLQHPQACRWCGAGNLYCHRTAGSCTKGNKRRRNQSKNNNNKVKFVAGTLAILNQSLRRQMHALLYLCDGNERAAHRVDELGLSISGRYHHRSAPAVKPKAAAAAAAAGSQRP